ncbi:MAG: GHKL domain-containing protein, partial [Calditrichaeota bacterium]
TIQRVVERFDIFKSKDHLQIEMEIPDSLPPIKGVSTEIETALENLIDNAIKYGADGGIVKITVKQIENEIEISVSDQGVGIPVEDQPRIFERFYRVDKGRSRALGGTGLGLSIVKHIVQRHGGRIWLESQLGHGSTFHFTLPLENSD